MSEYDTAVGVDDSDETTVYESEEGRRLTFAQIAFLGAKDPGVTVEPADDVEDGYYVDDVLYVPADTEEK